MFERDLLLLAAMSKSLQDSRKKTSPATVQGGNHSISIIPEQDRHTVRRFGDQDNSSFFCHHSIGLGKDHRLILYILENFHVGTVDLVHPDHMFRFKSEGFRKAFEEIWFADANMPKRGIGYEKRSDLKILFDHG